MPVEDFQEYMRAVIDGLVDDLGSARTRQALASHGLLMPDDCGDEVVRT